ncbi:hypothetical protein CE143_20030 [Photorhabdus luminescens]|uniref:Uncharacterized protein n=1 Tax=Photorhabdus akhurstii TaxID=171438 RepID=A0ABX8LZA7_9GAMM|nr:hypothetical protein [Photorhabdus akhurstii]QXF35200.1 hypothetical protein B0X70_19985 [Photorhabdus akhurstii]UJD77033.1 hypothetical protein CE143_20030 [Photorhabdus luminescens]
MTEEQTKYIGNPCPLGHTLRYMSNGNCIECQIAGQKKAKNKVKKPKRESKNKVNPDDFTHRVFILGNPERCKGT